MHRLLRLLFYSSFILHPSSFAFATDLSISLPLGPYYRPGKYIPVHITAAAPAPGGDYWVGLSADNVSTAPADVGRGAGRTSVLLHDGRIDAVFPWLVLDERVRRPRLFIENRPEFVDGPELRVLGESERLVGWTMAPDEAFARRLLGNPPKIIPVSLDPAQPIPGHAVAWEMLDALILDADSAARIDQSQLASLLACGVSVAVKTADQPPFPGWPWKRMGEYAVLRYRPVGPSGVVQPESFLPVANWQAGWPWSFRRRVLLIGLICSILLLGLAIWRPPMTALWAALLVAGLCFGIGKWWSLHLAIQQACGEIVVLNDGLTQTDGWTYQTTAGARTASLRWTDVSRPIYASRAGADDVWISLNCDTSGRPREFVTNIPTNRKLAFLSRSVGPRAPASAPRMPLTSSLAQFAQSAYLDEGGEIKGELPGAPYSPPAYGYLEIEQWNAIVIDRRGSSRR
jgi:hypothetical protein